MFTRSCGGKLSSSFDTFKFENKYSTLLERSVITQRHRCLSRTPRPTWPSWKSPPPSTRRLSPRGHSHGKLPASMYSGYTHNVENLKHLRNPRDFLPIASQIVSSPKHHAYDSTGMGVTTSPLRHTLSPRRCCRSEYENHLEICQPAQDNSSNHYPITRDSIPSCETKCSSLCYRTNRMLEKYNMVEHSNTSPVIHSPRPITTDYDFPSTKTTLRRLGKNVKRAAHRVHRRSSKQMKYENTSPCLAFSSKDIHFPTRNEFGSLRPCLSISTSRIGSKATKCKRLIPIVAFSPFPTPCQQLNQAVITRSMDMSNSPFTTISSRKPCCLENMIDKYLKDTKHEHLDNSDKETNEKYKVSSKYPWSSVGYLGCSGKDTYRQSTYSSKCSKSNDQLLDSSDKMAKGNRKVRRKHSKSKDKHSDNFSDKETKGKIKVSRKHSKSNGEYLEHSDKETKGKPQLSRKHSKSNSEYSEHSDKETKGKPRLSRKHSSPNDTYLDHQSDKVTARNSKIGSKHSWSNDKYVDDHSVKETKETSKLSNNHVRSNDELLGKSGNDPDRKGEVSRTNFRSTVEYSGESEKVTDRMSRISSKHSKSTVEHSENSDKETERKSQLSSKYSNTDAKYLGNSENETQGEVVKPLENNKNPLTLETDGPDGESGRKKHTDLDKDQETLVNKKKARENGSNLQSGKKQPDRISTNSTHDLRFSSGPADPFSQFQQKTYKFPPVPLPKLPPKNTSPPAEPRNTHPREDQRNGSRGNVPTNAPPSTEPRNTHPRENPRNGSRGNAPTNAPPSTEPRNTHPSEDPRNGSRGNVPTNAPPSTEPRNTHPSEDPRNGSRGNVPRNVSPNDVPSQKSYESGNGGEPCEPCKLCKPCEPCEHHNPCKPIDHRYKSCRICPREYSESNKKYKEKRICPRNVYRHDDDPRNRSIRDDGNDITNKKTCKPCDETCEPCEPCEPIDDSDTSCRVCPIESPESDSVSKYSKCDTYRQKSCSSDKPSRGSRDRSQEFEVNRPLSRKHSQDHFEEMEVTKPSASSKPQDSQTYFQKLEVKKPLAPNKPKFYQDHFKKMEIIKPLIPIIPKEKTITKPLIPIIPKEKTITKPSILIEPKKYQDRQPIKPAEPKKYENGQHIIKCQDRKIFKPSICRPSSPNKVIRKTNDENRGYGDLQCQPKIKDDDDTGSPNYNKSQYITPPSPNTNARKCRFNIPNKPIYEQQNPCWTKKDVQNQRSTSCDQVYPPCIANRSDDPVFTRDYLDLRHPSMDDGDVWHSCRPYSWVGHYTNSMKNRKEDVKSHIEDDDPKNFAKMGSCVIS